MQEFKINSFSSYLESKKQKESLIESINKDFIKQSNIATVAIAKDIINNVIIDKLNKLIAQAKNEEVIRLTVGKNKVLNNWNDSLKNLANEKESILSIVTSNLKQKKRVHKLSKAKSDAISEVKYIAYIGGTAEYQEVLTQDDDINLAIRFIDIERELDNIQENIKWTIDDFNNSIKNLNINYIENDFSLEFEILEQNSKFTHLMTIEDLDPELNYLLYGQEDDYDQYKESLVEIQALNQELQELNKKMQSL